jgi:hypothetical protein
MNSPLLTHWLYVWHYLCDLDSQTVNTELCPLCCSFFKKGKSLCSQFVCEPAATFRHFEQTRKQCVWHGSNYEQCRCLIIASLHVPYAPGHPSPLHLSAMLQITILHAFGRNYSNMNCDSKVPVRVYCMKQFHWTWMKWKKLGQNYEPAGTPGQSLQTGTVPVKSESMVTWRLTEC